MLGVIKMNRLTYLILLLLLLTNCSDKRKDCSDKFAAVFIIQNDIDNLIDRRKNYDIQNDAQRFIFKQTTDLLNYLQGYEDNLFVILQLDKPAKYTMDWCLKLKTDNEYKLLADKLFGEPCDLITSDYSIKTLYGNIRAYNDQMDIVTNSDYCKNNKYFATIIDPVTDKCITEGDLFFHTNLNNHLIVLLRLKEAILNQEELLIEKTTTK